jgi:hypothetical protein
VDFVGASSLAEDTRLDMVTTVTMAAMGTAITRKGTKLVSGTVTITGASTHTRTHTDLLGEGRGMSVLFSSPGPFVEPRRFLTWHVASPVSWLWERLQAVSVAKQDHRMAAESETGGAGGISLEFTA